MSILLQYRRSLKHPAAEELLDLLIYRPIAFVIARVLVRTPVTPNQITLAALACALAAAVSFALGGRDGLVAGAILYAMSNVLDCSDGMVARMKGNGTQLGRMIDVFADSVSGLLIYVGLGIGLASANYALPFPAALLVVAGGVSFAIQAALFDRQRNRFLARVGGTHAGIEREIVAVAATSALRGLAPLRLLARAYIRFMRWQGMDAAAPVDARTLRLWSFAGSTTHVTVVVVSLLLDAPVALFGYTIVAANLWCLALALRAHAMRGRSLPSPAGTLRFIGGRSAIPARTKERTPERAGEIVAVILAAGTGTRLRPLTDDIPKPLVEVGGMSLLERSIDALIAAGVRRFVVVAGFRAARVEALLDARYPSLDVEIVFNQRYDEANNAASLLFAAGAFHGERVLLLDGDLLYDPSIVRDLVAATQSRSRLVLRRSNALGEEEMKVMVDRTGAVSQIGKSLDPRASIGESIGIALFDASTTARLFATLEERMSRPDGSSEFYEASFQQMIDEGVELWPFDAGDRECIEIDTLADLAEAERMACVGTLLSADHG